MNCRIFINVSMKQLLLLLSFIAFSCSTNNGPGSLKLAGTTWVAKYSTNPSTGEILYQRYRFITDKEAVEEAYYQASKIISSIDLTYTYDPPKLLLTHDGYTYQVEVAGNTIKRGQVEFIRQ